MKATCLINLLKACWQVLSCVAIKQAFRRRDCKAQGSHVLLLDSCICLVANPKKCCNTDCSHKHTHLLDGQAAFKMLQGTRH